MKELTTTATTEQLLFAILAVIRGEAAEVVLPAHPLVLAQRAARAAERAEDEAYLCTRQDARIRFWQHETAANEVAVQARRLHREGLPWRLAA